MRTKSIYIKEGDSDIIKRAARLLRFHEDKALGTLLKEECEKIIKKYEPGVPITDENNSK